jgi:hypothetical protein
MQNKYDIDESNTTKERRNSQRERTDNESRYQIEKDNVDSCDQTAVNSSDDGKPSSTDQHDTILKRFKKKLSRKGKRNSSEKASEMTSERHKMNGRPESFEEDDQFEGHIYEVPFSNFGAQNGSRVAANMANNRLENGECDEDRDRISQSNTLRGETNRRGDAKFQNGSLNFYGGGNNRNLENANGSVNSRKERFQQGKSLSLPATSRAHVPLPGMVAERPRQPSDTSSEDSSNEELVQPLPRVKPEIRNLRSQSLPSPSKLNLNYQFLNGLNDLCKCGWYWGPLSSKEAEVKLHGKPDGAFLVRDSNDNRYLLSLSFRSEQKTLHTRIEFCKGKFSFYSAPFISAGSYLSVVELIDNCVETSKQRVYCYTKGRALNGATFPVRLTKPISRFEYVCTLQHLCRFVIRQHFTLENISDMPLPGLMKRYLGKNHFDAKPGE